MREMRASEIREGDVVTEDDNTVTVAWCGMHGDTVLIVTTEGEEVTFDRDTVVDVRRLRNGVK